MREGVWRPQALEGPGPWLKRAAGWKENLDHHPLNWISLPKNECYLVSFRRLWWRGRAHRGRGSTRGSRREMPEETSRYHIFWGRVRGRPSLGDPKLLHLRSLYDESRLLSTRMIIGASELLDFTAVLVLHGFFWTWKCVSIVMNWDESDRNLARMGCQHINSGLHVQAYFVISSINIVYKSKVYENSNGKTWQKSSSECGSFFHENKSKHDNSTGKTFDVGKKFTKRNFTSWKSLSYVFESIY